MSDFKPGVGVRVGLARTVVVGDLEDWQGWLGFSGIWREDGGLSVLARAQE